MKNFKNVTTEINKGTDENVDLMKFSHLAETCVSVTPKEGFDLRAMQGRLNLLGKLNHEAETIELEDAEALILVECAEAMRWNMMHKDLVAFLESVNNLK